MEKRVVDDHEDVWNRSNNQTGFRDKAVRANLGVNHREKDASFAHSSTKERRGELDIQFVEEAGRKSRRGREQELPTSEIKGLTKRKEVKRQKQQFAKLTGSMLSG